MYQRKTATSVATGTNDEPERLGIIVPTATFKSRNVFYGVAAFAYSAPFTHAGGHTFVPSLCHSSRFKLRRLLWPRHWQANVKQAAPRASTQPPPPPSPPSAGRENASSSNEEHSNKTPASGGNFYLGLSAALVAAGFLVPTICSAVQPAHRDPGFAAINFDSHYTMLGLVGLFALAHSGLASLRPKAVSIIGERLYRVIFALVSIPGAVATITYFIAHRYDGMQLWQIQAVYGVHEACYALTFLSFLLLYPATFNLLEVAAVQKPGFRIYENGVMRITRHPQLWGQVLWCIAHSAWLGTSMSLIVSAGLIAHHCFAVWNGDRRLRDRYGAEWEAYAARTSVLPFRAVIDGRQKLVRTEFPVRAYAGVVLFIVGAYAAHPAVLRAIGNLHI